MNFNLTLIAQAITFAVLILVIVKFVWPPLLKAIEARQKDKILWQDSNHSPLR